MTDNQDIINALYQLQHSEDESLRAKVAKVIPNLQGLEKDNSEMVRSIIRSRVIHSPELSRNLSPEFSLEFLCDDRGELISNPYERTIRKFQWIAEYIIKDPYITSSEGKMYVEMKFEHYQSHLNSTVDINCLPVCDQVEFLEPLSSWIVEIEGVDHLRLFYDALAVHPAKLMREFAANHHNKGYLSSYSIDRLRNDADKDIRDLLSSHNATPPKLSVEDVLNGKMPF